jgi:hypothetical protein
MQDMAHIEILTGSILILQACFLLVAHHLLGLLSAAFCLISVYLSLNWDYFSTAHQLLNLLSNFVSHREQYFMSASFTRHIATDWLTSRASRQSVGLFIYFMI